MSTDAYQLTLADYISIAQRRAPLIIGSFIGIFALAAAVALLMPPVFQSTGTILIESQQVPTELVQATVTSYAEERIEVIKQRVMTRDNLLRVIGKYKLFEGRAGRLTPSEQIDEVRKNTQVELITASLRPGMRGTGTIAFQVSYEDRNAGTAQGVANELVTLFLDENVKVRSQRATQTTEFMKQESARLRAELDKMEARIAQYKQRNARGLPENTQAGIAGMQRTESDLRQADRDYQAAEEEIRYLEDERRVAMATAQAARAPSGEPAGGELERARSELARLQATYTDDHPDVRSAKRRIQNLEQASQEKAGAAAGSVQARDPIVSRIDTRLAGLRARMNALNSQRAALRARLGQMEQQLTAAPEVERGLAALTRDHQAAQRKYEEVRAKQGTAQTAENLEGEQKAERFTLLEPPTLPEKPIRPDRKKMLALGLVLAVAGAIGITAAMETLHGAVRGLDAVSAVLGHRPLVTVPYIELASEADIRRRNYMILGGSCVAFLVLFFVAVHFLYLPLDLLTAKLMMRFG